MRLHLAVGHKVHYATKVEVLAIWCDISVCAVYVGLYRMAQKALNTVLLLLNIECEVAFASPCISYFVAVLILLTCMLGDGSVTGYSGSIPGGVGFFFSPP